MKIDIQQKGTINNVLLTYESDIVPMIGDTYAGIQFKDGYQRKIVGRLLFPTCPNIILVYVDYSFPNLVKTETELDQHEADLLTQQHLA